MRPREGQRLQVTRTNAGWGHAAIVGFCAATVLGCGATTPAVSVDGVLDDWHDAAAKADAERYFGHMAPKSVFVGTDATERWTKAAFETFARPYFAKGKAWTMLPKSRHVRVGADGRTAWFDEQLRHTKYGLVRGSGVMLSRDGRWRVAHYVLSFPVPNSVSAKVIELIKAAPVPAR
jgi:ketosteroid isomerase-like protein